MIESSGSNGPVTSLSIAAFGFAFLLAMLGEDSLTTTQAIAGAMILCALPILLVLADISASKKDDAKKDKILLFQFLAHSPCVLLVFGGAIIYLATKAAVLAVGVGFGVLAAIFVFVYYIRKLY